MRIRSIVITLLLSGCVSAAEARLTNVEKDDWERCYNSIAEAQCGLGRSAGCMDLLHRKYALDQNKTRFLVRHGCPEQIADG